MKPPTIMVIESSIRPLPRRSTRGEVDTQVPAADKSRPTTTDPQMDLVELKRHLLLKQRPLDPSLYYYNYPVIEADIRAGRPGKREYSGGYLCPEYSGVEFIKQPDREDGINELDDKEHEK